MPSNILEPGDMVADRYRIESELGRGGMGAVYVAEDTRFDERVALKVATAAGVAYDDFKDRFMREARIGNMLGQNAGFVRAFDWGTLEDGRTLYLAMDLIEGAEELDLVSGSLEDRLKRLAEAGRLVAGCHAAGVIHRDLKPGNFFQSTDGDLWLGDFGLAKVVTDSDDGVANAMLTQSGMGMGTPFFMPPEQFENVRDVGPKADVYALGAMLFFSLTQRYPYEGDSAGQILASQIKVRFGQVRQPKPRDYDPSIPRELDKLCWEATSVVPKRRLNSADEFVARLEAFLRDGPAEPAADAQTVMQGNGNPLRSGDAVGSPVALSRPPGVMKGRPVESGVVAGSRGPERHQSSLLPVTLAVGTFVLLGGVYVASRPVVENTTVNEVAEAKIDKPRAEQYQWLEKLVEKGDVPSMLKLAAMHAEDGNGDESVRLYRKAAKQGNTRAMITLGKLYEDGGTGVEQSDYMAKHWFAQALKGGDQRAKLLLQAVEGREKARLAKKEAEEKRKAELAYQKRLSEQRKRDARAMIAKYRERKANPDDPDPSPTYQARRTSTPSKVYPRPETERHTNRCRLKPSCITPTVCRREGKAERSAYSSRRSSRSSRGYRSRSSRSSRSSRGYSRSSSSYGIPRKYGEYHTESCRRNPKCRTSYACKEAGRRLKERTGPGHVRSRYGFHTKACKLRPKCITPGKCERARMNRYKDKTIKIGGRRRSTSTSRDRYRDRYRKRDSTSRVIKGSNSN